MIGAHNFIAYYRVSTDRQGRSGLGLDAQQEAVTRFVAARGGDLLSSYTEVESGRKADRPELQKALADCARRRATLVIARLDRLARNVALISSLMNARVDFVAVDMPDANRLTVHILAAVAEHERDMISTRTKEALKAAKARGIRLGNPRPDTDAANAAHRAKASAFRQTVHPLIRRLRDEGLSYRAIAEDMNGRALKPPRGRQWYASSVRNMILPDAVD